MNFVLLGHQQVWFLWLYVFANFYAHPVSLSSAISSPSVPVAAAAAAAPSLAAAAVSNPPPIGDLSQLLGGQRLKFSTPSEAEKLDFGHSAYVRFRTKFKAEVLDIQGLSPEDKFVELQARTKGEAASIVANFIYLDDKESALTQALDELKFYFGKKTGNSQVNLAKIVEGKEVIPNNSDSVKGLLQEVQSMVALARATKDDSFLGSGPKGADDLCFHTG